MRDLELKLLVCAIKIALEGCVSNFLNLGPSFYFMSKTGNFCPFFETCFSRTHKIKPRA